MRRNGGETLQQAIQRAKESGLSPEQTAQLPLLRAAAERALSQGFAIFACPYKCKAPFADPGGWKVARRDESVLETWEHYPANISIALPYSNAIALDVDEGLTTVEEGLQWARDLGLAETYTVRSGRDDIGLHFYLLRGHWEFPGKREKEHFGGKVKFRIQVNGYVMAAGSIHDKTGRLYQVVNDAPLADITQRLHDAIREINTPKCKPEPSPIIITPDVTYPDGASGIPRGDINGNFIAKGKRHKQLEWFVGHQIKDGITDIQALIWNATLHRNQFVKDPNDPSLNDKYLDKLCRDLQRKAMLKNKPVELDLCWPDHEPQPDPETPPKKGKGIIIGSGKPKQPRVCHSYARELAEALEEFYRSQPDQTALTGKQIAEDVAAHSLYRHGGMTPSPDMLNRAIRIVFDAKGTGKRGRRWALKPKI